MNQMDTAYTHSTVEALILASPEPISARKIIQVIEDMTPSAVGKVVAGLNERYVDSAISFRIREIAGGYQFFILPEYVGFVEELFARRRKLRLTRAALETTAIVAYRQPVTKGTIEHIRGVASDGVLNNLLEKKLVTIVGRADTVGKPLQYGTTDDFLKFFGLNSVKDLPKMAEIEELIAASEATDQTELTLVRDGEEKMVKLNVADGTFDPNRRDENDELPVDDLNDDELIPVNEIESETVEQATDVTEPISEIDADDESGETAATDEISAEFEQNASVDKLGRPDTTDSSEATDKSETSNNRLVLKNPVPQGAFAPVGAAEESDDLPKID